MEKINREEALSMLAGNQFSELVRKEEADSRGHGILRVPFYFNDRMSALSGAQSENIFLNAIQLAWDDGDIVISNGECK
jgi:predicted DsbA family dithiol-disulfide isomerase